MIGNEIETSDLAKICQRCYDKVSAKLKLVNPPESELSKQYAKIIILGEPFSIRDLFVKEAINYVKEQNYNIGLRIDRLLKVYKGKIPLGGLSFMTTVFPATPVQAFLKYGNTPIIAKSSLTGFPNKTMQRMNVNVWQYFWNTLDDIHDNDTLEVDKTIIASLAYNMEVLRYNLPTVYHDAWLLAMGYETVDVVTLNEA